MPAAKGSACTPLGPIIRFIIRTVSIIVTDVNMYTEKSMGLKHTGEHTHNKTGKLNWPAKGL